MTTGAPVHGGDLVTARGRFPDAPLPWIDLSTGINPHAYPVGTLPPDVWRALPDGAATARLAAAAARAYRVSTRRTTVAAPGTQALIQLLPRLLPARRVAVLGFGYEEHPAVWRAAGADVTIVEDLAALRDVDVAVVVNPNNPDGRLSDPHALAALAETLAKRGATLVVDEAFMDVADPARSLVPLLPERGAIVLRSFGKMFGLAGLRLGFAIAGDALATRIGASLGPWAVSGPALAIGAQALADTAWREATLARLRAEAARLDSLLARCGFVLVGGTPLFRLVRHPDAARCAERLGRAGLLVRSFPARPDWLRFGLPGDADAFARLDRALSSWSCP